MKLSESTRELRAQASKRARASDGSTATAKRCGVLSVRRYAQIPKTLSVLSVTLGCMSASYFGSPPQAELLELVIAHGVDVAHAVLECGAALGSGAYVTGDLKHVHAIHAVAQWTSAHGAEVLFRAVPTSTYSTLRVPASALRSVCVSVRRLSAATYFGIDVRRALR
jgi:hypothetical protein